ncbi:MAG: bifunctional folylpolyglutamate synthase/dihydrofolate synthase [Chloroflexi bacterium]|nr:bifunctional folylpolyglutamate synthase/dihydrofolate synthase [Chloroflexota bacterium]
MEIVATVRPSRDIAQIRGPHKSKSIIVAGTKGKGSTVAIMSSILTAAGYRSGMFTGPHLHSCRERFQINGRMISEDRLAAYVLESKRLIESEWERPSIGTPTKFEIETAIALKYFDDEKVDFAVLEIGIGGRHDAVNVATPLVSVITNISLEHTDMLGDSLAEIAYAKAGIIRPNGIVVSAPQPPEAQRVIESVCGDSNVRLIQIGVDWEFAPLDHRAREGNLEQYFQVAKKASDQPTELSHSLANFPLSTPLLGPHQLENATVAIAAIDELQTSNVLAAQVERGLKSVEWPGRLEILSEKPLVVVDGAHTPYSMQKLAQALPLVFQYDRLILVMGISSDKDIPEMLKAICPLANKLIITQFNHPRSACPQTVANLVSRGTPSPHTTTNARDAISLALDLAQQDDLVCITGSLYLVGEGRELLLQE